MAITDKKEGVWDTEEAYNKKNAGYWGYSSRGEGKSLWGWGYNLKGELGLSPHGPAGGRRSSPTQVGTDTTWASLQCTRTNMSLGIKSDGTLWSWGSNFNGALGLNGPAGPGPSPASPGISSPTQVGTNSNWRSIGCLAIDGFYATKFDGTLWAWGSNEYGALGLNDNDVHRSSPTQVGTDTTWNILNHGSGKLFDSGMAIKTDGTMWGWGWGGAGNLGNNAALVYSSPVQVGTDTNWKSFTQNYRSVTATKTNGTLWAWGSNELGILGLNDVDVFRSSPAQVGTDTNWDTIASNASEANFALKTDGTLWAWGNNEVGTLGLNQNDVHRSSPAQVGTDTTWTSSMAAYANAVAIKTNGTLWTWGNNDNGQLAQNNKTNRSSPVQVGTDTNWYVKTAVDPGYVRTVACSNKSFLALRTPS